MVSDLHATLEARFPGYRQRERFEAEPFRGKLLERRREETRHPCAVHGYEVDEDIEVFFSAKVLVLPRKGTPATGWCLLEVSGHSLSSVRYDSDGRSLHCTLDDGETFRLESSAHHQKRGRPNYTERGDVERLADHLRARMGYPTITDEQAAALVTAFAREYGG